ncbi:hypothetical protein ANO11243_029250 [Dothideomycetidae sp. 11243]|nr:hypothetical protein ANO11243_029250 [fungal sp. No.11243]
MGAVDLRAAGSYTIRLADSTRGLTSIRYNHKPSLSGDDVAAKLRRDPKKGRYKLSIQDDDDEFVYQAIAGDDPEAMVLLLEDEDEDGLLLEMVDATFACNLVEAPWESDRKRLLEQYPMLMANESDAAGSADAGSQSTTIDDSDLDPNNPFDFRNYISTFATAPAAATQKLSANATRISPPTSAASTTRTTPITGPVRRTANPLLPNQQRKAKARPSSNTKTTTKRKQSPPSQPQVSVPEVRISRTPSYAAPRRSRAPAVQDINLDDTAGDSANDWDLVLDDDSTKPARRPAAAHLRAAFEGAGPISLRSAASSPGSVHIASPHPPPAHRHDEDDEDELMVDAEDEDADVEHLALPAAADAHVEQGEEDEDDDLEQEMMRAMQEEQLDEDDGEGEQPVSRRPVEEEEEESEEE